MSASARLAGQVHSTGSCPHPPCRHTLSLLAPNLAAAGLLSLHMVYASTSQGDVPLYLHRSSHVLSKLSLPPDFPVYFRATSSPK